ncbi:unnamed protein product [Toxocara canis]|uniref:Transmembrane protein n=1 Tax=Toxocara canis TaxID=6265 RepID=A0A183V6W4_TOXCA|nr:unnamed protein product [Toxocara canis]
MRLSHTHVIIEILVKSVGCSTSFGTIAVSLTPSIGHASKRRDHRRPKLAGQLTDEHAKHATLALVTKTPALSGSKVGVKKGSHISPSINPNRTATGSDYIRIRGGQFIADKSIKADVERAMRIPFVVGVVVVCPFWSSLWWWYALSGRRCGGDMPFLVVVVVVCALSGRRCGGGMPSMVVVVVVCPLCVERRRIRKANLWLFLAKKIEAVGLD